MRGRQTLLPGEEAGRLPYPERRRARPRHYKALRAPENGHRTEPRDHKPQRTVR